MRSYWRELGVKGGEGGGRRNPNWGLSSVFSSLRRAKEPSEPPKGAIIFSLSLALLVIGFGKGFDRPLPLRFWGFRCLWERKFWEVGF